MLVSDRGLGACATVVERRKSAQQLREDGTESTLSGQEEKAMVAYDYPLGGVFLTMLYFFLFFIWIWILITVFVDIFRSQDLNGWVKALWCMFVIILPFLGVFVYLIARGGRMQERGMKEAAEQKNTFDAYVRETAGTTGDDVASQLSALADLKSQGVLSDAEYEAQKAKVLASN